MTLVELRKVLRREYFDPESYSLDGGMNWSDRYCIDKRESKWVVYFAERGEERNSREFESESNAVAYFLELIRSDPAARKRG